MEPTQQNRIQKFQIIGDLTIKKNNQDQQIPSQKAFNELYLQIYSLVNKTQYSSSNFYQNLKQLISNYVHMYISTTQRQDFFSLFCEHEFLRICQDIIKKFKSLEYYILIIQNLNMLSYNLKLDRQIVFFLSRPELNQIIIAKNLQSDESLDIYIQFLKSLVLRIQGTNYWKIFLNNKYPIFPLLWQTIKYYNISDKLIRTTVRNIVLQISRIGKFTIKAYLNNYPFIIFFAYQCCFLFDQYKQFVIVNNNKQDQERKLMQMQSILDDIVDQITFIEDLSKQLQQNTKSLLMNAFLYYFIKPFWDELIANQNDINHKYVYQVIVLLLFNQIKDTILKQILLEIFFQKFISKQFQTFFSNKYRILRSYVKSSEKQRPLDKCFQMIQEHASKCYNQMDIENRQVSESVIKQGGFSRSLNFFDSPKKKQDQSQIKKSSNRSFISKIPYISNLTWQKWLLDDLYNLSHGLGINIQRNKPINNKFTSNLYYTFNCTNQEQKQSQFYKRTINLGYTKLQRFIEMQPINFYTKMLTYKSLFLGCTKQQFPKVLKYLLEQLSVLIYILQRVKDLRNIKIMIQILQIAALWNQHYNIEIQKQITLNQKQKKYVNIRKDLMDQLSKDQRLKLEKQINFIAKTVTEYSQNQIFNQGWLGFVQIFEQQQRLRQEKLIEYTEKGYLFGNSKIFNSKIQLDNILHRQYVPVYNKSLSSKNNKQQPLQQQLIKNIYFYYLIRRLTHLLAKSKNQNSFFRILQNMRCIKLQQFQDQSKQKMIKQNLQNEIQDNKLSYQIDNNAKNLQSIKFEINGQIHYLTMATFKQFQIIKQIDSNNCYLQGRIKNLVIIKDIQQQQNVLKLLIDKIERKNKKQKTGNNMVLQLQFATSLDMKLWGKYIQTIKKQIYQLQIQSMIQLVQTIQTV